MILVPVTGDVLKTDDGMSFKVASFLNNKSAGPAVLAAPVPDGTVQTIYLESVVELQGEKVRYVKNADGYKIFETDAYVKRKFQLPQPGSILKSNASGIETREYVVKRLRLNVPNLTSSGLILDVQEEGTNEKTTITLDQIVDNGESFFNSKSFLKYYADYTPKG